MTHLTGFGVENFRVFKDETWFDFASITTLTGLNNSGKSSLIKSILLLKENLVENKVGHISFQELKFHSKSHQLGKFELCLNNVNKNLIISFPFIFPGTFDKLKISLSYKKSNNSNETGNLCGLKIYNLENKQELINLENIEDNKWKTKIDLAFFKDCVDSLIELENLNKEIDNQYKKLDKKKNRTEKEELELKKIRVKFNNYLEGCSLASLNELIEKRYSGISLTKERINNFFYNLSDEEFDKSTKSNYSSKLPLLNYYLQGVDEYNPKIKRLINDEILFLTENVKIYNIDDHFEYIYAEIPYGIIQEYFGEIYSILRKITVKQMQDELFKDNFMAKFILQLADDMAKSETNNKDFINENIGGILISDQGNKIDFIFDLIQKKICDSISKSLEVIKEIAYLQSDRIISQRIYSFLTPNNAFENIVKELDSKKLSELEFSFIQKWFVEFKICSEYSMKRSDDGSGFFIFFDKRSNADSGFGFSQLLVILLKTVLIAHDNVGSGFSEGGVYKYYSKNTIFIEEPENNLHPNYQSKLADMFLDAAKTFNIQFIIETHSEYFIRKLQYLTAKKEITPNDTVIYYFQHPDQIPEGEKQVKKINILEDGSLSDNFGPGFFDEASNLVSSIWEARSKN